MTSDLRGFSKFRQLGTGTAAANRLLASLCTCHLDCHQDSHSGTWHQHEDDPCPVPPDYRVVG
jgi:hypothetical protein